MKRINRPWLHFLLIGSALFLLQSTLYPPAKPSVGPLPESRLESLRRQWYAMTGRAPNEAQLSAMINSELDREILFREALELGIYQVDPIVQQRLVRNMRFLKMDQGRDDETLFREALRMELHLGDEVIKRRLVQIMEELLLAQQPPAAPSEAEIQASFEARRDELKRPPRYSVQQVYLARERSEEAQALLARFQREQLSPQAALEYSSPFLPGYRFPNSTPQQLARQFGTAFVVNLERSGAQVGTWVGPVESTYGTHLVWIDAIDPARDAELEEVRTQLLRDLELEKRRAALAEALASVRDQYEVVL
ncbi:MAG: peptidylprolyl isomerase [Halieaceae bacterium]|nr:peptidylprolyl isomerase [Halieaceae bacterium]